MHSFSIYVCIFHSYYLSHLARYVKWCIVIALKTYGHHFAILKPQTSGPFIIKFILMQTEINYVQHVSQISLQFIVWQWCDLFAMLSTLPPKSVLVNIYIEHSYTVIYNE